MSYFQIPCKNCSKDPIFYCIFCLRTYCEKHTKHNEQCDHVIKFVYTQVQENYVAWKDACQYYSHYVNQKKFSQANAQLQTLLRIIHEKFPSDQKFQCNSVIKQFQFLVQSTYMEYSIVNTQFNNLDTPKNKILLDAKHFSMLKSQMQSLSSHNSQIALYNTLNYLIFNNQPSTCNLVFNQINIKNDTITLFQAYTFMNYLTTFNIEMHQIHSLMKFVDRITYKSLFAKISFNSFCTIDQHQFLLAIQVLIMILQQNYVNANIKQIVEQTNQLIQNLIDKVENNLIQYTFALLIQLQLLYMQNFTTTLIQKQNILDNCYKYMQLLINGNVQRNSEQRQRKLTFLQHPYYINAIVFINTQKQFSQFVNLRNLQNTIELMKETNMDIQIRVGKNLKQYLTNSGKNIVNKSTFAQSIGESKTQLLNYSENKNNIYKSFINQTIQQNQNNNDNLQNIHDDMNINDLRGNYNQQLLRTTVQQTLNPKQSYSYHHLNKSVNQLLDNNQHILNQQSKQFQQSVEQDPLLAESKMINNQLNELFKTK